MRSVGCWESYLRFLRSKRYFWVGLFQHRFWFVFMIWSNARVQPDPAYWDTWLRNCGEVPRWSAIASAWEGQSVEVEGEQVDDLKH